MSEYSPGCLFGAAWLLPAILQVSVALWSCDAFHLCQFGLTPDIKFDVIDSSNLSDHTGLLNLLAVCGHRLKKLVVSFLLVKCQFNTAALDTHFGV